MIACRTPRSAGEEAPLIVRLAGLPLDAVQQFGTTLAADAVDADALRERLGAARDALVERLYGAIPGAPAGLRPFLLAVKRDCHNGRPLGARTGDARWSALPPEAAAVVELEAEAEERGARFEAEFGAETLRQRALLRATAADPVFARGVAMASPDLSDALGARSTGGEHGRKERKMEAALLRYVTRAATKLSPFSTLTPVGTGAVRGGGDESLRGVRLVEKPRRTRSLVRLGTYVPERLAALLRGYAPFRAGLRVELNDSMAAAGPGRFLLVRPRHWRVDVERGEVRMHPDALVEVAVDGALVEYLRDVLGSSGCTHGELVAALERELGGGVRGQVDGMVELGVLQLLMPWPAEAKHAERQLLHHLRALPADPALEPLVESLRRLVELQDGYAASHAPAGAVREIQTLATAAAEAAATLAGVGPAAVSGWSATPSVLCEDVFVESEGPDAAVAEVPRAAMEEALRNAELLVRLGVLLEDRFEFQHTLAAEARTRWPGRAEVGLLESVHGIRELWQEYARFHFGRQRAARPEPLTWNPLGLAELDALHRSRLEVHHGLRECIRLEDGQERICAGALRELLDSVPAPFTSAEPWGAMLHFQGASTDGSLWVLNQFKEGTGRYGSRYTSAMSAATRERYTDHFAARGVYRMEGESAELLDVLCAQGSTLNVHQPQTPRVLTAPGDDTGLPAARRVRLGDLKVVFDGPGGLPRIRGLRGERFLPVHLGFAYEAHMPRLLRYLCTFGPSELWGSLPPRAARGEGAAGVSGRTLLGNLVVHRRRWTLPVAELLGALDARSDAQAFAAVNRLRHGWGVPDQVFFKEAMPNAIRQPVEKPQYLDFTSPLFLPLLRGALRGRTAFNVTEMLPTPEMCPADGAGRRWMVELMLDSLALRRPAHAGQPV